MNKLLRLYRLTHLYLLLRWRKPDPMKFNMGSWQCGSSACALGTAALHTPFRLQGLTIARSYDGTNVVCKKGTKRPTFEQSYNVGADFFGITENEAFKLFFPAYGAIPTYKITPQMVASRVLELIKKYVGIK